MLRTALTAGLFILVLAAPASAATRSVTIPELWSSSIKSGTFSYTPETATAQVTFNFKEPVRWDFEKVPPREWQNGSGFRMFGKNRYSESVISVRLDSTEAFWSVSGYAGTQKAPWVLSPDAMSMSSTFTSAAIANLNIFGLGNEHYERPSFWVGPRLGELPLTTSQLDIQSAQLLAALRLKRIVKRKPYEIQTNNCKLPLSNTGSCRLSYKIGSQRWGVTVYLAPDYRALRRGITQWVATNSRPGKLSPLLPKLPVG